MASFFTAVLNSDVASFNAWAADSRALDGIGTEPPPAGVLYSYGGDESVDNVERTITYTGATRQLSSISLTTGGSIGIAFDGEFIGNSFLGELAIAMCTFDSAFGVETATGASILWESKDFYPYQILEGQRVTIEILHGLTQIAVLLDRQVLPNGAGENWFDPLTPGTPFLSGEIVSNPDDPEGDDVLIIHAFPALGNITTTYELLEPVTLESGDTIKLRFFATVPLNDGIGPEAAYSPITVSLNGDAPPAPEFWTNFNRTQELAE